MATLHLICGLPLSGKSTLAKKLEAEIPALRLTTDEWMERIVGNGYNDGKRAAVEAVQWEIARRVLLLGVDVILEFGFWSKTERMQYRDDAKALGADTRLYYLNVPQSELVIRLKERNKNLPPDTFYISEADLSEWIGMFEAPGYDELSNG